MDIFIIILILLFPCWLIIYLSQKLRLQTKYKLATINFIFSIAIILAIYSIGYGIWKIPIIYWFLIPNIFAGSIIPLFLLIIHTLFKQFKNQETS